MVGVWSHAGSAIGVMLLWPSGSSTEEKDTHFVLISDRSHFRNSFLMVNLFYWFIVSLAEYSTCIVALKPETDT